MSDTPYLDGVRSIPPEHRLLFEERLIAEVDFLRAKDAAEIERLRGEVERLRDLLFETQEQQP